MSFRTLLPWWRAAPLALAAVALAGLNSAASAHEGAHLAGIGAGLAHPFSGLDHLLAMMAVGVWAAQLGRRAVWALPLTFPAVMALGALLGAIGVPLPGVEAAIAASVVVLGAAILMSLKLSLPVSAALIAAIALFHGHAHGAELPEAASSIAYGAGFIAATLALHAIGLGLALVCRRPLGRMAERRAGARSSKRV